MITNSTFEVPSDVAGILIGHLFNWGLFGVLTVQVYIYYLAFPNDRIHVKTLVVIVYILEILQLVLAPRDAFRLFAYGFGNMLELDTIGWTFISVPIMDGLISAISQCFYAWRIWVLSKRIWIPIAIVALTIAQIGGALYTGINSHIVKLYSIIEVSNKKITPIWLGGTAACDILIAVSMTILLFNSRTGIRSTNIVIIKLVSLIIETGAICAAIDVVDLALFLRFQVYHMAPSLALSKLYSNSMLVVLNARSRIVGGRNAARADEDVSLGLPTLVFKANDASTRGNPLPLDMLRSRIGGVPETLNISVTTTHETHRDVDLESQEMMDKPGRGAVHSK